MKAFVIGLALVVIIFGGWLLARRGTNAVWTYNYRDEGTNVVFVTRKFDLILPGRRWSGSDGSFLAGNGVMMVRSAPGF